jgi:ubiquinone/menaquinone biosynthesis C-methylase UbiE
MSQSYACPWWLLFTFDNPLRKLIHDPQKILEPYVQAGDTVLDVGCGMGYFTLPLARLVKSDHPAYSDGHVVAADLQPRMLSGLLQRARNAKLLDRIRILQCKPDRIGLDCQLDFALAFWMLHEVRQPAIFLQEIYTNLKPGAQFMLVEPAIHVAKQAFNQTVSLSEHLDFFVQARPPVRFSRSVLLRK